MGKLTHQRGGLHAACILTVLAAAMLLYACAGAAGPVAPRRAQQPSLGASLAELDAMPVPEGVDRALWSELKDSLKNALADRAKLVATPPTGSANAVNDLVVSNDSGSPHFSWHYLNVGDYDQNGTVAIADITPLAVHFGETYDEITGQNSLAAVIDGSGNRKVDIADVTAIAVGFGVNCTAYKIQNAVTAFSSSWSDLQEVPQDNGGGPGRLEYAVTVDAGSGEYYRVVPVDADGVEGEPSNVRQFGTTPPEVLSVSPLGGVTGTQVQFTATVTGSEPISVQWDFGDGASPRLPYGRQVTVTLGDVDEYPASVTAINALDSDTLEFTLTVDPVPPDPPDIQSVTPNDGVTGTAVQFIAVVTGDEPFTYYWDFGMGATPNISNDGQPEVTLGAPGVYDTASLRVEGPGGEDTFPFTLTVNETPAGPVVVDGLGGDYPSLAIVEGYPAIAYRRPGDPPEDESETVFFVRALDENGAVWGSPVVAETIGWNTPGAHNNLVVVNGNPAIFTSVELMIEGGQVWYTRSDDSIGSAWGTQMTFWNAGSVVPPPTGFCVVAGNPAVAIPNNKTYINDLEYYRAEGPSGESWGAPVLVIEDTLVDEIRSCSMCLVGGNTMAERPAILLSLYFGDTLFILSSDEYGNSWETPYVIESMSDTSALCSVKNNPAVVWRRGGELPRTLYYMRADDEKGTEWTTKVMLDDWIISSGHIGFAVINGRPAVAYSNGNWDDRRLYYTVSDDETGTAWRAPVDVHPGLDVTENVSLLEVNGHPAIAYCEYGVPDNKLRSIRASDQYGYIWPE